MAFCGIGYDMLCSFYNYCLNLSIRPSKKLGLPRFYAAALLTKKERKAKTQLVTLITKLKKEEENT